MPDENMSTAEKMLSVLRFGIDSSCHRLGDVAFARCTMMAVFGNVRAEP